MALLESAGDAPTELLALSLDELACRLDSRTRAVALRKWLYGARPAPQALPESVPGIAPAAWRLLRARASLPAWRLIDRRVAADGTVKYAIDFSGATVETVLIPGRLRSTVCVSSQAGCTRRCAFCATASLGFRRQLTAAEIVMQYLVAAAEAPQGRPARNVVFMGMGEPMDNLDAVLAAVDRLVENPVPGLAEAHVTVSTSGVLPGVRRFLAEGRGQFALTLSATTDAVRERLIPHNRQWPIAALLAALRDDPRAHQGRRHLIAYVLWAGVNDSDDDARRLAELLAKLPVQVNLIPHNPVPTTALLPPALARVKRFHAILRERGLPCVVRQPRGPEIAAACGQLALQAVDGLSRAG
jgi:23S rRNA (adenine2503-C2)-methyltransferase